LATGTLIASSLDDYHRFSGWNFRMFIHEMSEAECRGALKRASVGRLACAHNNQPYVVPIYFAYDLYHLYAFSTLGQKIEWMRSNPLVCLEIDERISHEEWMSVVVFGRYEELPDTPENEHARSQALELLQRHAMWWEPAYVAAGHRDMPHSFTPISYRIHIDRMTGHHATPDIVGPNGLDAQATTAKGSWLDSILRHVGIEALELVLPH
jgi:nitroimidazol reductase NimA-like FMN-containing flavoprotein (pyridoxamine 5'-phosphate oxidase superfamily)